MFHVKHSKSNPVISFVFSRDYLRETRPEPPRLAAGPGPGWSLAKSLESLNESGSRAPGPWAGLRRANRTRSRRPGAKIRSSPGNSARIRAGSDRLLERIGCSNGSAARTDRLLERIKHQAPSTRHRAPGTGTGSNRFEPVHEPRQPAPGPGAGDPVAFPLEIGPPPDLSSSRPNALFVTTNKQTALFVRN